ncbi:hypothetical protein Tco_0371777, partial [Tanacetum coccineum]
MRTSSSSNLVGESSPNLTTSNPKRHNLRRSKQPFSLEESLVDTMADQRTMAELLRAPTEGSAEAIMVPPILAEHFELKHSIINMMTSDQFFGLEKDNPHDYIRCKSANKCCDYRHDRYSQTISTTPPPASVKGVEEICVTCGGAHPYYQCLATDGNTFRDNVQGYVSAAAVNYNQGLGYLTSNSIANPRGEFKAITTRSGLVLDGPSVPMPPLFINPDEDERADETLTDPELAEYTIKVAPPLIQKAKPTSLKNYVVHKRDPLHPIIPYPSRRNQEKHQEKDEVQIHNFWQMFKQLHINISLADALILIPEYQKMVKSLLSNKEKLLELANTPLNENCSA